MLAKQLPIYRKTQELLKFCLEITQHFPNKLKYNLGSKIIDNTIELLDKIRWANIDIDNRSFHITESLKYLHLVESLIEVSFEMKLINTKKIAKAYEIIESLNKQALGWQKKTNGRI